MTKPIYTYTITALLVLATSSVQANNPGEHNHGEESQTKERKPLYWVAPMDKNYRRDGPGLSPMGMELIPVYEDEVSADSAVKITPNVVNNLGVKTAEVRQETLRLPIRTVGTVQYDESRISHLHSRVEGWIETLHISAKGDPVRKGQLLFELYSPALVNAQEEFLAALRSGNAALQNASRARLSALGLSPSQVRALEQRRVVDRTVRFEAERDGIVLSLNVRQGMFIMPATELMAIGTLDSVWVIGEVFERQAYQVKTGQAVTLTLRAAPQRSWTGQVSYLYPELNAQTRSLAVRIKVANPDHFLKPNMLASLEIETAALAATPSIPRSALIRGARHQRVVKALEEGRFQSVLVEAGLEGISEKDGERRVQILSGLESGERVVTSAQFLIDSESNIEAELARMQAQETEGSVAEANQSEVVEGHATIVAINASEHVLKLDHAPIPALGWPQMTMNFDVDPQVDLSGLKEGAHIVFEMNTSGPDKFLIRSINGQPKVDSKADQPKTDHSSMDHSTMNHAEMDHSDHDHGAHTGAPKP